MLETFTLDTFAPHRGEQFAAGVGDATILALTLEQATPLGAGTALPEATRAPFSLVFLGPPTPILPQQIYRLTHEALGAFELFLVPIGRAQAGIRYEAVFT
jgi:hypothetical protein